MFTDKDDGEHTGLPEIDGNEFKNLTFICVSFF